MRRTLRLGLLLAAIALPALADAQTAKVEIGASLANAIISVGDNDNGTVFGVPSSGFGLTSPGVYASFFVAPRLAVEPQLGLVVASFNGDTSHIVNFVGQVNYFLGDVGRPGAYLLGSAGIIDSGEGTITPKTLSAGVGYRFPVGSNLSFRLDGRYTRFFIGDEGANTIGLTFSIGGLFGQR
jgi:hypothetical protein